MARRKISGILPVVFLCISNGVCNIISRSAASMVVCKQNVNYQRGEDPANQGSFI